MTLTKGRLETTERYRKAKLDRFSLYLPKGQGQIIKAHAKQFQPQDGTPGAAGYSPAGSVNAFINRAIREAMERDLATVVPKPILEHVKAEGKTIAISDGDRA